MDASLPLDDPTVSDDGPIVPRIGSISEHDFDAVAIQIENGGIEVAILVATRRRRTIGTPSSDQRCSIEVSNSGPARGGERYVGSASFYAAIVLVAVWLHVDRHPYPGVSWHRKKSASRIPRPI